MRPAADGHAMRALRIAREAREKLGLTDAQLGAAFLQFAPRESGNFEDLLLDLGFVTPEGRNTLRASAPPAGARVLAPMDSEIETIAVEQRPSMLFTLADHDTSLEGIDRGFVAGFKPQLEKYQTSRPLGRGGMGEVFEMHDVDLGRRVALKRVRSDLSHEPRIIHRFIEEAQITAQLEHPNIIPIHDIGSLEGGIPFFTMKRVEGNTLGEVLRGLQIQDPKLTQKFSHTRLQIVFLQVVQAISYAHARGVLHCDIKPSNILLGEHDEVLVTDWGLAQLVGADTSGTEPRVRPTCRDEFRSQTSGGTAPYMSPEQMRGVALDPRSDIYSLGVVLYELLTGSPPYTGRTAAELEIELSRGPVPPREKSPNKLISAEIEAVCLKALQIEPAQRYQTAASLKEAIEAHLTGTRRREQANEWFAKGEVCEAKYRALVARRRQMEAEVKQLSKHIRPYDGEERKKPLWALEDELHTNRLETQEALADTLNAFGQAANIDSSHLLVTDKVADLQLELMLEAEARGDRQAQLLHKRQVEQFHRGRHRAALKGKGLITLRFDRPGVTVEGFRLVEHGKRILPDERLALPDGIVENLSLDSGSYLFKLSAPGAKPANVHIYLGRGRNLTLQPKLYPDSPALNDWVHVPAGPFFYGGDPIAVNSEEREEITLPDFVIAKYAVTCGEYLEFLDGTAIEAPHRVKSYFPRTFPEWEQNPDGTCRMPKVDADGAPYRLDIPIMGVSFDDAIAFINWRSKRDNVIYRLPTEYEWEKAARGADGRWFPWGNGFDATFCKMALSRPGRPLPEPIGTFPVDESVYGMRDAAGCIREWCDSFFDEGHETRILRGGAWYFNPSFCRVAFRHGYLPHIVFTNFGFRLCKNV